MDTYLDEIHMRALDGTGRTLTALKKTWAFFGGPNRLGRKESRDEEIWGAQGVGMYFVLCLFTV